MLIRRGMTWFKESDAQTPGAELEELFTGTKILCVGRNYKKHAVELGNDVPEEPLWFSKPPSSIISEGESIIIPEGAGRIDYEGELALVIGERGKHIHAHEAERFIAAVVPCFDITARELQKKDGQWTRAKGFDTFLPLGMQAAEYNTGWQYGNIEVRKNGKIAQKDTFKSMVFGFCHLLSHISACMTLEPGDIILTGTPEGVGPICRGDCLEMRISADQTLSLAVNCS